MDVEVSSDNKKIRVTGQQAFNLIKPYCTSRIYEQMKAVVPLALYLVLFQFFVLQYPVQDFLALLGGLIAVILGESPIVTVTPFLNKTSLLVSSVEAISETFLKLIEEAPFDELKNVAERLTPQLKNAAESLEISDETRDELRNL